jgi:hypothetical protein
VTDAGDELFDQFFMGAAAEDDVLEDPGTVARQQCAMWADAAGRWRFQDLPRPNAQASPSDVKDALVEVRARLDSIEVILSQVISFKAGTAAQAESLERVADDAWDDQALAEQRRPRPEYQGSKERYAYWNIAIRVQRARARDARDLANLARSTYDQIKLHYDGLNETRRDLAARLTHARWEIHLEQ